MTWSIDTICWWYVVHWWRYRLNRVIEAIAEVWVWDERPWFNKKKIMGMELIWDSINKTLFLSQKSYTTKMLEKFGMLNSKAM